MIIIIDIDNCNPLLLFPLVLTTNRCNLITEEKLTLMPTMKEGKSLQHPHLQLGSLVWTGLVGVIWP